MRKRENNNQCHFVDANSVDFLCDGDEFFPRLIKRIRNAQYEIVIETFILADDRVGRLFKEAIIQAARRNVWVAITADGWGSYYLPEAYIEELVHAGVIMQFFDPQPDWLPFRPKLLRRLHRKLAVIDGKYGFVGGINICADHLSSNETIFKKDYAVEITGPLVLDIRSLCMNYIRGAPSSPMPDNILKDVRASSPGPTPMALIQRDNANNKRTIEQTYIEGFKAATHCIYIANAYLFPGYRIMRALRKAAERGVEVHIVIQGNPDIASSLKAARSLYSGLTQAGINIYEYKDSALHAKIAAIDDEWAFLGSSNLDPWSLTFNLEANVLSYDSVLNDKVKEQVRALMSSSDTIEGEKWAKGRAIWQHLKDTLVYHLFRLIPFFIGSLPETTPNVRIFSDSFDTQPGHFRNRREKKAHPESRFARQLIAKKDVTL